MDYRDKYKISAGLITFTFFFVSSALAETFTDESVHKMFKSKTNQKAHGVMAAQRERLRMIMDGFIIGDPELIQQNVDELETAMQEVFRVYPPKSEDGPTVWAAMSEIMTQSQAMKKELSNKDYRKAYIHYTHIAASCIQCHQAARSWGKFEEPKIEGEKQVAAPLLLSEGMARYIEMKPPVEKTKEAPKPTIVQKEESKNPESSNKEESDWPTLSY